ncbi:Flp pilus assembly complex ATPase component TadA, partial [Vibrio parahaemolyticus]|nr:Flp pilus assembly complex ATPase component TadA [Vibrio parahaemolyticus]
DVKLYTKMDLETVIATQSDIEALIDKYYTAGVSKRVLQEFDSVNNQYDDEYVEKEQAEVASAPIVRLINTLFEQALKMRASDIHLEPGIEDIRVRFRIDGDLTEIMRIPRFNLSAIVTRIKILGKMNIAEKRIP